VAARVLIATRSGAKARELRELLQLPGFELVSLDELAIADEIPEDGQTFDENAVKKALGYARLAGLPAIADDSGLEVDALGGAPGVRTRRFAGPEASDEENNAHLLRLLDGVPSERRMARYRCTLVLATPTRDGDRAGDSPRIVAMTHGTLEGRIALASKGSGGFGYDPIFEPEGEPPGGRTLAEYGAHAKNRISHRGRAARAMRPELEGWIGR
jgi:XTP/dITP diphosphohydrolase